MKQRILGPLTILAIAVLAVTTGCGVSTGASSGGGLSAVGHAGAKATATAGGASTHHSFGALVNTQAPPLPATAYSKKVSVPASVDLSQFNPPVGAQETELSCVAWAVDYYLRGWYAKRDGYYPLSGFSPDFTYDQVAFKGPTGSRGGSAFSTNLKVQETEGLDTNGDYFAPSTAAGTVYPAADADHTPVADSVLTNAARYKITNYYDYLNSNSQAFVTYIKTQLASQNPVAIIIYVSSQFYNVDAKSPGDLINGTSHLQPGSHAIFVYGYNQQGLLIENSWGTGWGYNGYAELSWGYVESLGLEVASIIGPTETAPAFQQLPGTVSAISVGADGAVWALGTNPATGGYGIFHWNPLTWSWTVIPGEGGVRLAVDPNGEPWIVNNAGNILHWDGTTWLQVPAPPGTAGARDLAISRYGTVWMIAAAPPTNVHAPPGDQNGPPNTQNTCPTTGCAAETIPGVHSFRCPPTAVTCAGGNVYSWTGSAWQLLPGDQGNRIAVAADYDPWVINSNGGISYYQTPSFTGSGWMTVWFPGSATALAVGGANCLGCSGSVWAIDSDGNLLRWYQGSGPTTGRWDTNLDSAVAVAATSEGGNAWVVNSNGAIFELPAWADLDPSLPVE